MLAIERQFVVIDFMGMMDDVENFFLHAPMDYDDKSNQWRWFLQDAFQDAFPKTVINSNTTHMAVKSPMAKKAGAKKSKVKKLTPKKKSKKGTTKK